jgi:hypothetical protein
MPHGRKCIGHAQIIWFTVASTGGFRTALLHEPRYLVHQTQAACAGQSPACPSHKQDSSIVDGVCVSMRGRHKCARWLYTVQDRRIRAETNAKHYEAQSGSLFKTNDTRRFASGDRMCMQSDESCCLKCSALAVGSSSGYSPEACTTRKQLIDRHKIRVLPG